MLVEDMSRKKCFFFIFEYHMPYTLYPFVTHLLIVTRTKCNSYNYGIEITNNHYFRTEKSAHIIKLLTPRVQLLFI
jgi:hypothetical protein